MKQRNPYVDYIKGLAIFLVVWGHSLQFTANSKFDFFSDIAFTIIYTFHMGLFMAVSGYLFFLTQRSRSFGQLVQGKTKQILIPTLLWAGIRMLADYVYKSVTGEKLAPFTVPGYINYVTFALWFLWALYICALLNALISKHLKDSLIAYAVITLLVLLLPNTYNFSIVKYMVPYHFAGYLYHKYQQQLQPVRRIAFYASFLLFPLLLLKWNNYVYIYISGVDFDLFSTATKTGVIIYRYAIGAVGIILFVELAIKLLFPLGEKVLVALGKQTLGIYILGAFFFIYLLIHLQWPVNSPLVYDLLLTPAISVIIAFLSYWLTILLSKSPTLDKYLLGGR